MKKIVKILFIFVLILNISVFCFAGYIDPEAFGASYGTDLSEVKTVGQKIFGYITNIAAISSGVLIAYLGLKFMLGSVDQRAEYKKSFLPLIVGMFIVLTSSSLVNVVWKMGDDTAGTGACAHKKVSICTGVCETCGKKVENGSGHSLIWGDDIKCSRDGLWSGTCDNCGEFVSGLRKNGTTYY